MSELHWFWTYQVRYRLARRLIIIALKVWPPGPGRASFEAYVVQWGHHVLDVVSREAGDR